MAEVQGEQALPKTLCGEPGRHPPRDFVKPLSPGGNPNFVESLAHGPRAISRRASAPVQDFWPARPQWPFDSATGPVLSSGASA